MADLEALIGISRHYGRDPDYVLAGGGNTSLKVDDRLYIKASGTTLGEAGEATFVAMERPLLARVWDKTYPGQTDQREAAVLADLLAARSPGADGRPSVETLLHDLFAAPFVVHTHPTAVNGLTCGREGKSASERIFGDEALWIEAMEPGYVLAARLRGRMAEYSASVGHEPSIVLIQNHGVFVAGETITEIKRLMTRVMDAVGQAIEREPDTAEGVPDRRRAVSLAPAVRMALMEGTSIVTFRANTEIQSTVRSAEVFEKLSLPFTPDHMVYCGRSPLYVSLRGTIEEQQNALFLAIRTHLDRHGVPPRVIAVEGLGVYCWGTTKKEADTAAALFWDAVRIAAYAESFGGAVPMPPGLVDFIGGWEVEKFRKSVTLTGAGSAPLAEKIAIVTGSAQGFGEGLARQMVAAGANVVIADLNGELARQRAVELAEKQGAAKAIAAAVDVSDEASVEAMIERTVLEYGGLDVLVSNAGVLRAGDMESMDVATFEFVTRVNYTAFFICARHAARVFRAQHRLRPGYYTDIVQINSKSGLSGSKKNFAYAGGKFGGIGLVQSFALELVEYNVKVNAICPGNFFDGPLWSDPDTGLFVQYLQTEKVPGARTVEDVRRHYEALVPMRRGCEVEDVFKALLYIVDQKYETGQALPVTGGQIMLR